MKTVAIVLSAGTGRRMGGKIPKQYMELAGKPVICHSLEVFERSFIDEVILVCGEGYEEYCRKELVIRYGLSKVVKIIEGGRERYHSVYRGLMASGGCDYVFIHDGARPFVTEHLLERCLHYVEKYGAAVAAVRASDTVKIEDGDGFIKETPDRAKVWLMQTPQVFGFKMIREAYGKLIADEARLKNAGVSITDDTMVAKMYAGVDAKLVESSSRNLKITTPQDMVIAEALCRIDDN
ncbi:MAG: 2-C-methyl-D-erythritol 4-phosphate cytidylyltransferase [Lachnospiraceae bacterium]|nr:2-C-methyl-D-erythritol 4-phosphate cytidylyltransferase [Lachnospiraceae bacterium]